MGKQIERAPARRARLVCETLEERRLLSVSFTFDYSLDVNHFFDTQAKKDLLQEAGQLLASRLGDRLAAITPGGINTWSAVVDDPATGLSDPIPNLSIPADTILVYVGGRSMATGGASAVDDTVGEGGPAGFTATGSQAWVDTVQGRGQPGALAPDNAQTDFSPAVGSITFDTGASWYLGTSASGLGNTQTDFLSVALHELGHVLGIGTAHSWVNRIAPDGTFAGAAAEAAFGGPVPLDAAGEHWAAGTTSGGAEAAMDPVLRLGTRKLFTPLDWAGLQDVGWQVSTTAGAGITVQPAAGLTTTEAGGQAVFRVVLNTVPTSDVTIALVSSNPNAGNTAPASLTFTPANALTPQTVTVTGVDDGAVQGDVPYTVFTQPAVSADPSYDGLDPTDVSVTNLQTDPTPPAPAQPAPTPQPVPSGVVDVTTLTTVLRGKTRSRGGVFRQVLTLTYNGSVPLDGPVSVVFTGLGRKARLLALAGTTHAHAPAGSPYLDLPGGGLTPGETVSVLLRFRVSGGRPPRYGIEVLAGPGDR